MITKINLQEILAQKPLEGYLWCSNKQKPKIYPSENPIAWPTVGANPFIIEGNLYDADKDISYQIKFIDGEYHVYRFDLKQLNNAGITKHEYLPNRMPGIEKLIFKEVWLPVADPLCEGLEVLKPSFIAFTGFKKQED